MTFAGWMLGPIFAGGVDGGVRPEYFTLLPIPPRRLAAALLGAGFVGIGPAISLVKSAALVVFATRLGVGPALVAVPAAALELVCLVLLARVVLGVVGELMRSRLGTVLSALPWAAVLALSAQGWVLVVPLGQGELFTPALSTALRVLPSGWAVVAVEAAGRSDWLLALGALAGLASLAALLLAAWARLLVRRVTGVVASGGRRCGSARRAVDCRGCWW